MDSRYNALRNSDPERGRREDCDGPPVLASLQFMPEELFWEQNNNTSHDGQAHDQQNFSPQRTGLSQLVSSITSRTTTTTSSYDMVEGDDYAEEDERDLPGPSIAKSPLLSRPHLPHVTAPATTAEQDRSGPFNDFESKSSNSLSPRSTREQLVRTASGRDLALRHPTPDFQVLQGAYTGNIQHLERSAERLSMTSSIDDGIGNLPSEHKQNDSRRSSLLSNRFSHVKDADMPALTKQLSNSSIVETHNVAQSGAYSSAGFWMSPKGSFTNPEPFTTGGRGRSASKSSRFGSRPEPELEGRPLDSFVNLPMPDLTSPILSRSASIDEQDESSKTLTKPVVDLLDDKSTMKEPNVEHGAEEERPTTSASTTTFDQAQTIFADFDGVHSAPQHKSAPDAPAEESENSQRRAASGASGDQQSVAGSDVNSQRRVSSGNRQSMARPQSYADPNTGQQMVYYPAPVPMMLNLPQKLSKMPSSMARNKRRTQVLSSIPQAARQSVIWLPDVLETEDEPDLPDNDEAQKLEYVPQHQRMSMGGRRITQDIQHLPPQLRANAFFELPGPSQVVELKEQSAVATLDSILDASAHAPVSAFTDHAFAGHLGAEVYGKANIRNSKSSTQLLSSEPTHKKRTSSFNLLKGRRASSSEILETENDKKRANTISDIRAGRIIRDPLDEEEVDEGISPLAPSEAGDEDQEEEAEELYHGAPTTLLAELQLRKQQAKMRTRPVASAYPNGIRSTLLELDAVAQVEQKSRKQKRIHLAWEDTDQALIDDEGDDEDVPLAMLYAKKSRIQEPNRPLGLMERRDMEDNEPLSRRRDRLQGKPPMPRASTMMNLTGTTPEEEEETLAQRVRRMKGEGATATGLPSARPVSGDFASEMMSQFGGGLEDPIGKGKETSTSPAPEGEETLGQRRKRLQAEREARAREVNHPGDERLKVQTRRSMADILAAHPAAGASRVPSYGKGPSSNGLLGLHEKERLERASTMFNLEPPQLPGRQASAGGFKAGLYNDGQGGIIPQQPQTQRSSNHNMFNNPAANFHQQQFPQPSLGVGYNSFGGNQMMMPFANPYAMGGYGNGMQMNGMQGMNMGYMQPNPMASMNMLQMGAQPLNQGQIDMVERWRQSIMQ